MKSLLLFLFFGSVFSINTVVQRFDKPLSINNVEDYLKTPNDFNGNIFVVLVAGSNGYFNYRHQADVCHAYHVVHNHGIPDENIIVMMYDDIANSKSNPFPGTLINHPNGPDVYKGVKKDYTGEDVTPENFMNVLTGNETAMNGIGSGKVLKSGPNDHVFIFFSDHGAPNLIGFPQGRLYKEDMNKTLMTMYKNKMYKQLVFYLEACNSGSMFDKDLGTSYNMYITTAANAHESSYACYYDKARRAYLGDRYSVTWMEDSDKENLEHESLHHQYKIVRSFTNESHVQQFGNKDISHEIVGLFQGQEKGVAVKPLPPIHDDVPSPDVVIQTLKNQLLHETSAEIRGDLKKQLTKELDVRRRIEKTTSTIADNLSTTMNIMTAYVDENQPIITKDKCYRESVEAFHQYCFDLDQYEYGFRQLYKFGNMCEMGIPHENIVDSIKTICK